MNDTTLDSGNSTHFQNFITKLNTWASNYTFSQPPPPNISYKYPLPTRNILLRIAIQLINEPAFYTQVLHLMNKMNLPPPFEELEYEFPDLKEVYNIEKYKDIFGEVSTDKNSDDNQVLFKPNYFDEDDNEEDDEMEDEESEIESDEETNTKVTEIIPVKRKLEQSKKRLKIPKFINPNKQMNPGTSTSAHKVIRPEDMFESVKRDVTKNMKIELKPISQLNPKESSVATGEESNPGETEGGFGKIFPKSSTEDDETKKTETKPNDFITSEELAANRISSNDQRLLPVFKNYHPGKPSYRLYIKNLSKQVTAEDLHYIYRRYVIPSLENSEIHYDIRLMQEGRMKGQAFVTFQNMGQAQLAINETNGFILKDKPMVVQFAKTDK